MTPLILHHWPLDRLVAYANNPRKNDAVVDRMIAAIREFGFRIPIVAQSDGTVVDGHLRLKAARELKLETVPVVLADELTPAQIKAFRLLANQSSSWAEWDEELLKLELEGLKDLDVDLDLTGFDDAAIAALLTEERAAAYADEDADSLPAPTPEAPLLTRPGDLWLLGSHQLVCGDCCDPAAVQRLLANEEAAMTLCDPPYNVNYGQGLKDKWRVKQGKPRPRKILNDNLGDDFTAFLEAVCATLLRVTKGALYIFMASRELSTLHRAFQQAGGHWSTYIIWVKNHFALGQTDYHSQYEPFLYGWKEGAPHYWCGARNESDVWFIDKPSTQRLHPTQKPVALMERAIINSSQEGEVVFDPFGGSGTTLIACEKTKRACRMIELDPFYCDVIIQRWQEYTGSIAYHAATGQSFSTLAQAKAVPP